MFRIAGVGASGIARAQLASKVEEERSSTLKVAGHGRGVDDE